MGPTFTEIERLRTAIQRQRLVDTAVRLIAVPSPTGAAKGVLDCLADILRADGFAVERPDGGYPQAPAVAVRFKSAKPGRTLQFDGHLDTVHLPFIPPAVNGDRLTGSGSCDMKSGVAAAVEAVRVLRDTGAVSAGGILLTAHDLHEAPWGDGRQLNRLIADGFVGDGVLIPEYLNHCVPVIGRGGLVWKATVRRAGPPVHEVMRPPDAPNVLAIAAELVQCLLQLNAKLSARTDPLAGCESLFIGQIHGGEIYNQYPRECWLEGTRRWLPDNRQEAAEAEMRALCDELARSTGVSIDLVITPIRGAFVLNRDDPLVSTFQAVHAATAGRELPFAGKPFIDDGNSFWSLGKVPTITHGPNAGGAHTLEEWVSIADLERVALVYALTALRYCAA